MCRRTELMLYVALESLLTFWETKQLGLKNANDVHGNTILIRRRVEILNDDKWDQKGMNQKREMATCFDFLADYILWWDFCSSIFMTMLYSTVPTSVCCAIAYIALQKWEVYAWWNDPAKHVKTCYILYIWKPKVAFSIFHFVLLYFPPGLRGHRPGHSLGKK